VSRGSDSASARRGRALRVPVEGLDSGQRELTGAAARYIQRVHRLGPGDSLLLFDPLLGLEAEAQILSSAAGAVLCQLDAARPSGYRAAPICLLQALAKGAKPDSTIAEATALGVERIVFLESERVVVRLEQERGAARRARWQRIAVEAARQCGRGNVPAIQGPLPLQDVLAQATDAWRLQLSPHGAPLLAELAEWRAGQSVALLVGPEGGLSAAEVSRAEAAGFRPASLGRTTLRTELAGVAALGAVVAFGAVRGIG
jgi:16S rRNA (uracil1498-N3)-methyltransferase